MLLQFLMMPMNARQFLVLLAFFSCAAYAQVQRQGQGTLGRIQEGGELIMGYRDASIPFSYMDAPQTKPLGYAIDICEKLAQAIRKSTGKANMRVKYEPVTAANRIEAVKTGKVDLECGSTTNNAERRKVVSFTLPHFIAGARMLVRTDSKIEKFPDLAGLKVVSTAGTTPLKAINVFNQTHGINMKIVEATDHAEAFKMVQDKSADAFVMDDVLLYGLIASSANPGSYKVIGNFLTTEALAVMISKNEVELKQILDTEMKRLIRSGEIKEIYERWFLKPIPPKNTALNLKPNHLLLDLWRFPSDFVFN